MIIKSISPCLLTLLLLAPGVSPLAQVDNSQQEASSSTSANGAPAKNSPEAIEFLKEVEEKHADTKTLAAKFTQVREDKFFGDTVESKGEFWYVAPNKFRASYESQNSSEVWMIDDKVMNYVPSIQQVDVMTMESGEDAPINQLLLGFGIEVDKITEVFSVTTASEERNNLTGIDFISKDLARSMDFKSVTIYFDEGNLEPKVVVARNPNDDIIVTLRSTKVNGRINDSVFERDWPDDVEVVYYGQGNEETN